MAPRTPQIRALISAALTDRPRLRLALLAGRTSLELRRHGLGPVVERLDPALPPADSTSASALAGDLDRAFELLPLHPTCLRRSATLVRELDRRGRRADLVIGVRNVTGRTEAHAWVEADGVVVNDEPERTATYQVIATGSDLGTVPAGLR